MARLKVKLMKGCSKCDFIYSSGGLNDVGNKRYLCELTNNEVPLLPIYPKDCPLPDAPDAKEEKLTDAQQLKAEIVEVRKYIENMRSSKMSSESILNHVDGTLRQLSAV